MKYLLDTHCLLWLMLEPNKLSDTAKTIILDADSPKYASIVSSWEVALMLGTGKLGIDGGLQEFYRMIDENGFFPLGIEREHISRLSALPLIHRDPFDRMLISCALVEGMTLVTSDSNIRKYDVPVAW